MIKRGGGGWLPWRGAFAGTAGLAVAALLTVSAAVAADTAVRLVNPSDEDALVRLVGPSNKTVWVQSGKTREVPAEAGDYTLLVRYGIDPHRFSYSRSEPFQIGFAGAAPQATVTLPPVRPLYQTAARDAVAPTAAPPATAAAPPPEDRAASMAPPPDAPLPQPPPPDNPPFAAGVLSGRIANLQAAASLIDASSHLQLVKLPENNQLTYFFDAAGRIKYASDLPAIDLPADGAFRMTLPPLLPGRYVVVGQSLDPASADGGNVPVLADVRTGRARIVEVAPDASAPAVQDLGEVVLALPAE